MKIEKQKPSTASISLWAAVALWNLFSALVNAINHTKIDWLPFANIFAASICFFFAMNGFLKLLESQLGSFRAFNQPNGDK